MHFASIRIITTDVRRLAGFYELVTGLTATWRTDDFAELATSRGTLAFAHERTVKALGEDAVRAGQNRSVIVELRDDDVDATFARARAHLTDVVQPPTTMPWGNRSALVRDPDGNLLNLFTPVSDAAKERAREK
jgi:predicted enzyme related to lactoylglutathione lyase